MIFSSIDFTAAKVSKIQTYTEHNILIELEGLTHRDIEVATIVNTQIRTIASYKLRHDVKCIIYTALAARMVWVDLTCHYLSLFKRIADSSPPEGV